MWCRYTYVLGNALNALIHIIVLIKAHFTILVLDFKKVLTQFFIKHTPYNPYLETKQQKHFFELFCVVMRTNLFIFVHLLCL